MSSEPLTTVPGKTGPAECTRKSRCLELARRCTALYRTETVGSECAVDRSKRAHVACCKSKSNERHQGSRRRSTKKYRFKRQKVP